MTTLQQAPEKDTSEVTFSVTGMTCASCVRRIEKALGRVDGVAEASVNLATEKAHVMFNPALASMDQMRAAVENVGIPYAAYAYRSCTLPLVFTIVVTFQFASCIP